MTRMKRIVVALLATILSVGVISVTAAPQAAATTGKNHWARSTIYLYHATPSHPWEVYQNNREDYYRAIATSLGIHYKLVDGLCQKYFPCIRVEEGNYGASGWQGLTMYPNYCGTSADPYTLCNFVPGVAGKYMTIKLNTYYPLPDDFAKRVLACHELGHAVGDLNHTTAVSCMRPGDYSANDRITNTEASELKTKFASIPYAYGPNDDQLTPTSWDSLSGATGNDPDSGTGPLDAEALPPGPSVYYFGTDHCPAVNGYECYFGDGNPEFRMDSANGADRLEFVSSGGGNFIGWNNPGSTSYWFTSHTTGYGRVLVAQKDCNVVVYQTSGMIPLWDSNTDIGQTSRECKIVMSGANYFTVYEATAPGQPWYKISTVPLGH